MISRFQRVLLENLPLIVVQLIFMQRNGLSWTDFTQMKTFITTLISILSSLNRVWDAKPSLFQRKIFKNYYEILEEKFKRNQRNEELKGFKERVSIRKAMNLEDIMEVVNDEAEDEEKKQQKIQIIIGFPIIF